MAPRCTLALALLLLASNAVAQNGVPIVIPQQKKEVHNHDPKPSIGLLAILASIFGGGGGGGGSSGLGNCYGSREMACTDNDDGRESFSSDSFANVRSTAPSDLSSPYKVLGPFRKYYDGCVRNAGLGDCRFVNLGIKGDASHKKRRSCHNAAQAIDVGPLTCSSGRRILPSDPKFFEVAKCMANNSNDELEVIFYKTEGPNMKKRSDHNNHMHIQIKNCAMVYG